MEFPAESPATPVDRNEEHPVTCVQPDPISFLPSPAPMPTDMPTASLGPASIVGDHA